MTQPTPVRDDHAALERHILRLVGQLVGELRSGSAAAGIGPGDSLERELGIGSLERVELLTRIERGVGVRLADSVMAAADTPADLVRAVVASEPAVAETLPSVLAPVGAAIPAPPSARRCWTCCTGRPRRPRIVHMSFCVRKTAPSIRSPTPGCGVTR